MNNNLRKIKHLIGFHWVFIKNNPLIWILTILGSLIQLILLIVFNLLGLQLVDFALLIFLVPNIIYSIFIIVMSYTLIQVNKDNSIDDRLLCSEFNKYQIKIARFVLIWIFLGCMIVISDLCLFYFVIVEQLKFGVATFVSNTFITPFILLLISIIFTYLAIKNSKGIYVFLTILILMLSFGLSLITRVFIPKSEIDASNYYKLIQKDSQYLVEKTKSDVNLNQTIKTNTFIPSEWFYSFYSWVFSITDEKSNSDFSIRYNLYKYSDYDRILENDIPIMIRPQDINFLNLSNNDYANLLFKNIEKVIEKHNLNKNVNLVKQTIEAISNNFDWSYIYNPTILRILFDSTGINTEFNQLYYFIKYNKSLNIDSNLLINKIKYKFNDDISHMFQLLLESESTYFNLFKGNSEFNSLSIYPNSYIVNNNKPITKDDLLFIKSSLIKFINNDAMYLNSDGEYTKFDISVLQKYDTKIINQETYENYVDSLSFKYSYVNDFLNSLKLDLDSSSNEGMINYSLSNNYIDMSSIYSIYQVISSSNLNYSIMFIGLISFINVISNILFFVKKE